MLVWQGHSSSTVNGCHWVTSLRVPSQAGLCPDRLWDPSGLLANRRRSVFAGVKGNQSMKPTTHMRVVQTLPMRACTCTRVCTWWRGAWSQGRRSVRERPGNPVIATFSCQEQQQWLKCNEVITGWGRRAVWSAQYNNWHCHQISI